MSKILLLTHSFPPYAFPESYLSAKQLGNLPDTSVDVVTMESFLPWVREDHNFAAYVQNKFNSINYIKPPKFYKNLPFHRLEILFSFPDAYRWLNHLYKKYINDLSKYDAVVTWSMYHSIHLLGLKIKEKTPNFPWLAHFSDPWVNNPFLNHSSILKKINASLERQVFEKSDALMFTSQETLDIVSKGYSDSIVNKMHVIPHNFDQTLYAADEEINNKFVIRYLGSFYGKRQPDALLKAILILQNKDPSFFENIHFEFVGSWENKKNPVGFDKILDKIIVFKPPVSYLESLKLMKSSDLLLIIDAPFEFSPFLPSKLVDYIGANRPIFGITPAGTSKRVIEELGYLSAHPNSPDEIALKLELTIKKIKEGMFTQDNEKAYNYSSKHVGKEIKKIISKLIVNYEHQTNE